MVSGAKYKAEDENGLKILTSKQMPQRLPVALAQVKAGNTSENWMNDKMKNHILFVYKKRNL